jgi:hypothetical protein
MKITRFEDIEAWQQASLILSFECLENNFFVPLKKAVRKKFKNQH